MHGNTSLPADQAWRTAFPNLIFLRIWTMNQSVNRSVTLDFWVLTFLSYKHDLLSQFSMLIPYRVNFEFVLKGASIW